MEGQLATEDMRSQEVPYEILSVNCVVEILDKVFKLAYIYHISSKSFRSGILASLEQFLQQKFRIETEERFLTGPIMVFGDRLLDALC